ncbi:hypothetical protein DDE82_008922 [Stemphylium lycopersici]|nr:hypothetical protein DDE82_008922 [Stemphylium lycopersici]
MFQKDVASKTALEHKKSSKTITITPPDSGTGFQESDPVDQEGCIRWHEHWDISRQMKQIGTPVPSHSASRQSVSTLDVFSR